MQCARRGELNIRVDHKDGSITFVEDAFVSADELSRKEKEEEEARRVREDLRKGEQERTKKEIESIRIDEAKKYAQSLVDKGILKPNDVDVSFIVVLFLVLLF